MGIKKKKKESRCSEEMVFLTLLLNLFPAVTQLDLVCPEGPKRISQGF